MRFSLFSSWDDDVIADGCTDETEERNQRAAWYHVSDTHVKEVSVQTVLNCQAYMLFYERVR